MRTHSPLSIGTASHEVAAPRFSRSDGRCRAAVTHRGRTTGWPREPTVDVAERDRVAAGITHDDGHRHMSEPLDVGHESDEVSSRRCKGPWRLARESVNELASKGLC